MKDITHNSLFDWHMWTITMWNTTLVWVQHEKNVLPPATNHLLQTEKKLNGKQFFNFQENLTYKMYFQMRFSCFYMSRLNIGLIKRDQCCLPYKYIIVWSITMVHKNMT